MAAFQQPAPRSEQPWIGDGGRPAQALYLWVSLLDKMLRTFVGANNKASSPVVGPLVAAANDAAAAALGVPVGGLYANGNAVQIRLV